MSPPRQPRDLLKRVPAGRCRPTATPPTPSKMCWGWGSRCAAGGARRGGTARGPPAPCHAGTAQSPSWGAGPCWAASWGHKQWGDPGDPPSPLVDPPPHTYHCGELGSGASTMGGNGASSGISSSRGSGEGPPGRYWLCMKGLGGHKWQGGANISHGAPPYPWAACSPTAEGAVLGLGGWGRSWEHQHWEHRSAGAGGRRAPPCANAYMGFLKATSWQRGSAGSITRGGESICEGLRGERGR